MSASNGSFDVDAFLDGYTRRRKTVTLYRAGHLLEERERLEAEVGSLAVKPDSSDDELRGLVARIEELDAEYAASAIEVTVSACGTEEWNDLVLRYPPTDEDRKADPDAAVGREFEDHALALCLHATVEGVRRLRTELRPADWQELYQAMVEVNSGGGDVPKSPLPTAVASLRASRSTNRKQRRSHGASGRAGNGKASRSTSTTKKAS